MRAKQAALLWGFCAAWCASRSAAAGSAPCTSVEAAADKIRSGAPAFALAADCGTWRATKGAPAQLVQASFLGVGAPEAFVIAIVALLVFGPKGLAEARGDTARRLRVGLTPPPPLAHR